MGAVNIKAMVPFLARVGAVGVGAKAVETLVPSALEQWRPPVLEQTVLIFGEGIVGAIGVGAMGGACVGPVNYSSGGVWILGGAKLLALGILSGFAQWIPLASKLSVMLLVGLICRGRKNEFCWF
jgi:hypothetical protein